MDGLEILAAAASLWLAPMLAEAVKRWKLGRELASAVNVAASVLLYLIGWWLFTGGDGEQLQRYILLGAGSGGLTCGGYAGLKRLGQASGGAALDRRLLVRPINGADVPAGIARPKPPTAPPAGAAPPPPTGSGLGDRPLDVELNTSRAS